MLWSGMFTSERLELEQSAESCFLRRCKVRFPHLANAVKRLQEIGRPPADLDLSHPAPRFTTALQCLGALVCHTRVPKNPLHCTRELPFHVTQNWPTTFNSWLNAFMKLVLDKADTLLGQDEVELVDRILEVTGRCLCFGEFRSYYPSLKDTSPHLQPLVTQVFFRVIHMNHPTWGLWSTVLMLMAYPEIPLNQRRPPTYGTLREEGPYKETDELGLILVRHIDMMTRLIPSMDDNEIYQARLFLMCIDQPCFESTPPLYRKSVLKHTIPALARFTSTTLRRYRPIRDATSRDIEKIGESPSLAALQAMLLLVNRAMRDVYGIVEGLDAGIIDAVFKAYEKYFWYNDTQARAERQLMDRSSVMLDQVSRFLFYPDVLHAFLRLARRIERGGSEERMKALCRPAYDYWQTTKEKAFFVRSVRDGPSGNPAMFSNCSYSQCGRNGARRKHLARCSRCWYTEYCSSECQKHDWLSGHRKECESLAKGRIARTPRLTPRDRSLLGNYLRQYVSNGDLAFINKTVLDFLPDNATSGQARINPECRAVAEGLKLPMLSFALDRPKSLQPEENMVVSHPMDFGTPKEVFGMQDEAKKEVSRRWWSEEANAPNILVVGVFPRDDQGTWHVEEVMKFPLGPRMRMFRSEQLEFEFECFLRQCRVRFPHLASAVKRLQENGRPPADLDFAHPTPKFTTALQCFGALAYYTRIPGNPLHSTRDMPFHITQNWPTVSPWLNAFLELVLGKTGTPLGRDEAELVGRILEVTGRCLCFGEFRSYYLLLKDTSPHLQPLVTQVFFRVIDINHPTWGLWSTVLMLIAYPEIPFDPAQPTPHGTLRKEGPYKETDELGQILVRHVDMMTRQIPSMDDHEIYQTRLFLMCIDQPCFESTAPLFRSSVLKYTIPALIRFTSTTLRRYKPIRDATREDIDDIGESPSMAALQAILLLIRRVMRDTYGIVEALDAGVIRAVFKAHEKYFWYNNIQNREERQLVDRAKNVLDLTSRFLFYPDVLHAFLQSARRIEREGLEGRIEGVCKPLYDVWQRAKERAFYVRDMRDGPLKNPIMGRGCSYPQCGRNGPRRKHLARCSRCWYAEYCSSECQKHHWSSGHRQECTSLAKERAARTSRLTPRDRSLLASYLHHYISENDHAVFITQSVMKFIRQNASSPQAHILPEGRAIANGLKLPLISFAFDRPKSHPPQKSMLLSYPSNFGAPGKMLMEALSKRWWSEEANAPNILVVGMFPRSDEGVWHVEEAMKFPFK
ncbi:hypothetical protein V5O48_005729 [Marasmius crinis-equi]|uniref:MYND-type domain-containing protein n=1 Tax=Marasmius crinis-equi TaxID=585013 RepID=A0ABR3FMD4_9AGAR